MADVRDEFEDLDSEFNDENLGEEEFNEHAQGEFNEHEEIPDEFEEEQAAIVPEKAGMEAKHIILMGVAGIVFLGIVSAGAMKMMGGGGAQQTADPFVPMGDMNGRVDMQASPSLPDMNAPQNVQSSGKGGGAMPVENPAVIDPVTGGKMQITIPGPGGNSIPAPIKGQSSGAVVPSEVAQANTPAVDVAVNTPNMAVPAPEQAVNYATPPVATAVAGNDIAVRVERLESSMNDTSVRLGNIESSLKTHEGFIGEQGRLLERVSFQLESFASKMTGGGSAASPAKKEIIPERMKGFSILSQSETKDMVIVKAPTDRVIVLFKGERVIYNGRTYTVTNVSGDGKRVELDNNLFIDTVREKPVFTKTANKSAKAKQTELKIADGWSVVGYAQNEAVINRRGTSDYVNVKIGQEISGLGLVKSFTPRGDVVAGDYIIHAVRVSSD